MKAKERKDIIQYIVQQLIEPQGASLGKVKMQKAVYFLQEGLGIPLGYDFVMHYYGPYASELDDILTEMRSEGRLSMTLHIYPTCFGYDISLGENPQGGSIPAELKDKVDRLAAFFKKCGAQDMELYATIHFVQAILGERSRPSDVEDVINEVVKLKPKFDKDTIRKRHSELVTEGLLNPV